MNKRNLWLIIGPVVVIVAIVIGMNVRKGSNGTSNEFRIGAIVFQTGPQAALGTEVRNAVSLAQEEVNAKGGINGKMMNVLFEDSKDSPRDAIAAFNRLETVSLPVVLSTGDVVSLNLAPNPRRREKDSNGCNDRRLVLEILQESGWVFRIFIQATRQADTIANYAAKDLGLKSAAVLAINNEFGNATSGTFKSTFERLGGKSARSLI